MGNDLAGLVQLVRPHFRRLLPPRLHHAAGHTGRWLLRTLEQRLSSKSVSPPANIVKVDRLRGEAPIVLVNASLTAGGAERQVINLLRGLTARRRRALLLTLHLDQRPDLSFFIDELKASNLTIINAMTIVDARDYLIRTCGVNACSALRESLRWAPSDVRDDTIRIAAELHRLGPSVVHGWQDATGICAAFAALAVGTERVIVGGRNLHPEHFSYARPYMLHAYDFLAKRSEVTLTNNSAAGAESYSEWLGLETSSIHVIRNGIATTEFIRPTAEDIAAFRRHLGLQPDELVVGGIFRLQAEKRPLLWLEVAARLSRNFPKLRFVIFGDGTMRHRMLRAATRLGLRQQLIMPGNVRDARMALAIFNVLLLTSSQEGTPNVVLEAALIGVPVVATDAGGTAEAIADGRTGLIVREKSIGEKGVATALADAVTKVLSGKIWIDEIRTFGLGFIAQHYGLDRMIEETLALYGKPTDLALSEASNNKTAP